MTNTTRVSKTHLNKILAATALGAMAVFTISPSGTSTAVYAHSDSVKTETRDLAGFSKIDLRGAADMEIKVGDSQSVTVTTTESMMKTLETSVEGGVLMIDTDEDKSENNWSQDDSVKITITMTRFEAMEVRGAVDAEISGIDSESVLIDIKGAAEIDVDGTCGSFELAIKGASDVNARKLECDHVEVDIKGAGDAKVYASKSVDADISGVGNIDVYGNPDKVRDDAGFLGSINLKK